MCIKLTHAETGEAIYFVKANIVRFGKEGFSDNKEGSAVTTTEWTISVKESPDCIHDMMHAEE